MSATFVFSIYFITKNDIAATVSKDNTGGQCEELNDMHQRHVGEEKNMDRSEPQSKGVTWADIVKKETIVESIKNNSH